MVQGPQQHDDVVARISLPQSAGVADLRRDATSACSWELESSTHMDIDGIDHVDRVTVIGKPGGVHARRPADIEDAKRWLPQMAPQDLLGPQELELAKTRLEPNALVNLIAVVRDNFLG
jgi:hypothetical protein